MTFLNNLTKKDKISNTKMEKHMFKQLILLFCLVFIGGLSSCVTTDSFTISYQGYSKIVNNTQDTIHLFINDKFLTNLYPYTSIKLRAYAGMHFSFNLMDEKGELYYTRLDMFDDKYLKGYVNDSLKFIYRLRDYTWPTRNRDTLIIFGDTRK